ncbi:MAG: chaperonin GroEL [Chloroflexi bacterium]|nr:chaperonin GroEL [Chloroflexota bacterium]
MSRTRRVIFQPKTYETLQGGIDTMVNAIRPTLGPLPRIVALEKTIGDKPPELLDDGGVIMRRIIQIADRDEDMGAMLVRQLLWRLHEQVGDGTATAAVLLQSIFRQGVKYIVSGGNAMMLRRNLERGMRIVFSELEQMAVSVEGQEALTHIAESICYDAALARLLGEIFDIIGEYGRLETRSGRGRDLEREYVEGMYWKSQPFSRDFLTDEARYRTQLDDAAILISDVQIEDPRELVPAMTIAMKAGVGGLLVISKTLSEGATALVLVNNRKNEKFQTVVTKVPGLVIADVAGALEDIATLTGGRAFRSSAGERIDKVKLSDLGRARRAWIDRFNLGIVGGQGDPRALREHIAKLREAHRKATDPEVRRNLQERIGKLMGGSATLWVGGMTESEIEMRKELANRTAEALRGAVREGVVPGGGVALMDCRPTVRSLLDESTSFDEQMAYRILLRALEEPMRVIIENAGFNPDETMAEVRLAGPGHGFDVRKAQVVNMREAGIFDSVAVTKAALHGAIQTAALALTVDVLIHRKKPPESMNP